MHIQPIFWRSDKANHLLIGSTNGLLSHIEMYVCMSNSIRGGYEITSNIKGFDKQYAIGVDSAKLKAQECLTAYAMCLILQ
jgi:hypothetical protein